MGETRPNDTFNIRDRFAAAALTGLCTGAMVHGVEESIARQAYMLADALIQVRKTMLPPPEPVEPEVPEGEVPVSRKR